MKSGPTDSGPSAIIASGFASDRGSGHLAELPAEELAARLDLKPHQEGGYFRETYRAQGAVRTASGARALSTAILYLLTADDPSRIHRLASDELWFYHAGLPAELVLFDPGMAEKETQRVRRELIGPDVPHVLVPARWWMGARVVEDDCAGRRQSQWTLVSCVVTPGFDYEDFEAAGRDALLREYPCARNEILDLT